MRKPAPSRGFTRLRRRKLAKGFKEPTSPFTIVIVRGPATAGLTGFDAPCLHTMYADKPMEGQER